MIQEILPNNWSIPFGAWEQEYCQYQTRRGKKPPSKFQGGSRAIYKQLFKSNVYGHIMRMYNIYRSYPIIKNIRCKSILACIANETRHDLDAEKVTKFYAHDSIKEEDFNSMYTDYMKELLKSSGAKHLTVFEVLLVFYVHWLWTTSNKIRKYYNLFSH